MVRIMFAAIPAAMLLGIAGAHVAIPAAMAGPSVTVTVDGTDYPLCEVEDCSDQPGQLGVWVNSTGDYWLSIGETSIPVRHDGSESR